MLAIHKASAGSGKTFALTRDYIKLLLAEKDNATGELTLNKYGHNRHRSILAITFTNKATEEMKRRIVHELAVLGGCEPGWTEKSPYENLADELGCTPEELKHTAASALKELLLDFNSFRISTIDSFFQTILRTFAREAELTGNYEIELDRKMMINQSVGQLLTSLRNEHSDKIAKGELENWLLRKVLDSLRRGNAYNLFNRSTGMFSDLVEFINSITNETFLKYRTDIFNYLSDFSRIGLFADRARELTENVCGDLKSLANDITDYIASAGFEPKDVLMSNPQNAIEKWLKMTEKAFRKDFKPDSKTILYMELLDESKIYRKISKGRDKGQFVFRDEMLDQMITRFGELAHTSKTRYIFYSNLRNNSIDLGLVRHIDTILQQNLTGDNLLLLSDTGTILEAILGDNSAPFVFERIGAWLRHFLIDEFQDTSEQQWRILRPLVENALADGSDSLIIGDEKQCIYRFRNSDPTLLQSGVAACFAGRVNIDERGSRPEENTNWRSSKEVVEFNNMLFSRLADQLGFKDIYANVNQLVSPPHLDHHGYIEITSYAPAADKETTEKGEKSSKRSESVKTASLSNMMDNISRQLNAGYKPSDIVVLVRWNKDGQEIMDFIMRAHEINSHWPQLRVVSDDSFELGNSPVVRMIISILRVIATGDIAQSSHKISKHHYAQILEEIELNTNEGLTRSEALSHVIDKECRGFYDDKQDGGSTSDEVKDLTMKCVNLTSLIERIIRNLVSPAVREIENVYIAAFADTVTEYQQRGHNDISSFLSWWETTGSSRKVNIPPDENAIRIITIHKAKGLEFPCVHIPMASWEFFKGKSIEWFDLNGIPEFSAEIVPPYFPMKVNRQLVGTFLEDEYHIIRNKGILDELNVTYVAFTRAVDELIVGCFQSGGNSGETCRANTEICKALGLEPGDKFTMGEPTTPTPEKQKQPTAADPSGIDEMPDFISWERNDIWNNTRLDTSESISEQRLAGINFHAVMAKIINMDDISRVCHNLVSSRAMSLEDAETLSSNIREMIVICGVERWFSSFRRVLCEPELTIGSDESRRPDRVVWLQDGSVEVIDYKTGERDDARYSRQVGYYMHLLKQSGCRVVRGYVWYVNTNTIVEVGI